MTKSFLCAAIICLAATVISAAETGRAVIIYDGRTTEIAQAQIQSVDLWVTTVDLKRATGFVIKPQGVCRDELCFPIPKNRKAEFVTKQGRATLFNLTAFAKLTHQAVAWDEKNRVWYFGPRADARSEYLATLEAPDFTLSDMNGQKHSLRDFRGKKVLLVTWASW
jgi:hypothetical protein